MPGINPSRLTIFDPFTSDGRGNGPHGDGHGLHCVSLGFVQELVIIVDPGYRLLADSLPWNVKYICHTNGLSVGSEKALIEMSQ